MLAQIRDSMAIHKHEFEMKGGVWHLDYIHAYQYMLDTGASVEEAFAGLLGWNV